MDHPYVVQVRAGARGTLRFVASEQEGNAWRDGFADAVLLSGGERIDERLFVLVNGEAADVNVRAVRPVDNELLCDLASAEL